MTLINTTSTQVAPILNSLAPGFLEVPTPQFNYAVGAEKYSMPWQGGKILRFIRPELLDPPITPLGNSGIEPAPQLLNRSFIDAEMQFYGTSTIINEQLVVQNQDGVLAWGSERLAVAMRQAEDLVLRQFLAQVPNEYNCRNGSNGDIPTEITFADASIVGSILSTRNAQTFSRNIVGDDKFGTGPIRQRYLVMAHTEIQPSLDVIPQFRNSSDYPNPEYALPGEYGSLLNLNFLTSSQSLVSRGASNNGRDIYQMITTGRQGYSHIDQDGYGMEILFRPREFSGPLGLNYTMGIKFAQSQALTQSTWVLKTNCTGRF